MRKLKQLLLPLLALVTVGVGIVFAAPTKTVYQWLSELPNNKTLYTSTTRYIQDNATSYRIDVSTSLYVTGTLTASALVYTTISTQSITTSDYVTVGGSLTVTGAASSASQAVTYGITAGTGTFTGVVKSTGVANYGSLVNSYVSASTTTLTASSNTIVECTASTMTVTLPTAVGNTGLTFTIKKTGSAGTVTIVTNGSETVDGVNDPAIIKTQYDYLTIVSNGANWIVVARYIQ